LKNNISWDVRAFDTGPPVKDVNLVFLRNNLLTYYKTCIQKTVFNTILDALAPSGRLVIGSRESLPGEYPLLKVHPSCAFVYKKSA